MSCNANGVNMPEPANAQSLYWANQLCWGLILMAAAGAALPQAPENQYQPTAGQPGKDVVWVPTADVMVEKMLDMARVTPQDYVIDLGSGDGRNVIAAAKRGARALGIEYNPDLVALSRRNAAQAGVADKATFVQGDMYEADISQASVLALFLLPDNLSKLAPKLYALKPGSRIVSNTYEIGGGWSPDETARVYSPCSSWCVAVMYIVPPKVTGIWQLPQGELTLEQDYQHISGTLEVSGISLPVENGRLRGEEIRFTVNRVEYAGRVTGDTMRGIARGRTNSGWTAARSRE